MLAVPRERQFQVSAPAAGFLLCEIVRGIITFSSSSSSSPPYGNGECVYVYTHTCANCSPPQAGTGDTGGRTLARADSEPMTIGSAGLKLLQG